MKFCILLSPSLTHSRIFMTSVWPHFLTNTHKYIKSKILFLQLYVITIILDLGELTYKRWRTGKDFRTAPSYILHSVLEQRKQWQKQYISIGKTDLFYNSKGLCGNFTCGAAVPKSCRYLTWKEKKKEGDFWNASLDANFLAFHCMSLRVKCYVYIFRVVLISWVS